MQNTRRETDFLLPSQALAEDLVLKFNGESPYGMLTAAIRPAGIYGERDTTVSYKMIEHASRSSLTALRFQLGPNNNLFDFTYVGNVAYSHMLAAERLLATKKRYKAGVNAPLDYERVDGEGFIITNDSPVYFWDMAHAVWALMGRVVEPHQVWEMSEGVLTVVGGVLETVLACFGKTPRLTRRVVRYSCMTRYYSCDKAKQRLGYVPVVPVDEGVARSVANIMEQKRSAKEREL